MSKRQVPALLSSGNWRGAMPQGRNLAALRMGDLGPDATNASDLPALRARSQDLMRNSAIGGGAVRTVTTKTVGTGLALSPVPAAKVLGWDKVRAKAWGEDLLPRWQAWFETTACDAAERMTGYQLQRIAFNSALENGDCFAVLPMIGNGEKRLAVQIVEAFRVCNPDHKTDTPTLSGGVRMDAYGRFEQIYIAEQDPRTIYSGYDQRWQAVDVVGARTGRRNVLHLALVDRPGQTRGVPLLAPVIETIAQLTKATDAEIAAAVIAGVHAMFITSEEGEVPDDLTSKAEAETIQPTSELDIPWDRGGTYAVGLAPGEKVESVTPGRPNSAFAPFVDAMLVQVGMALEIPHEVLTKRFMSSYSAARAALLEVWQMIRMRRDWLATAFLDPLYDVWLAHEVLAGRVSAPGFFSDPLRRWAYTRARWVGDGPGSIDPVKEIAAATERVALGVSTRADETMLHSGGDFADNVAQLAEEKRLLEEAGLWQDPVADKAGAGGANDPADKADQQDQKS